VLEAIALECVSFDLIVQQMAASAVSSALLQLEPMGLVSYQYDISGADERQLYPIRQPQQWVNVLPEGTSRSYAQTSILNLVAIVSITFASTAEVLPSSWAIR